MAFEVSYRNAGDVLIVEQAGAAADLEQAAAFEAEVESRLATLAGAASQGKVLFDNRKTEPPPEAVRKKLHAWLTTAGRFGAAALLLESEMLALSINMEAMSQRLPIKAFASEAVALEWLAGRHVAPIDS